MISNRSLLDLSQPKFSINVVTGLHIHSFALYYVQNIVLESKPAKTTVVICAHTSRIHILSMTLDWIFQLLQLLQHDVTGDYSISLTTEKIQMSSGVRLSVRLSVRV
jgi:hypothetical protein